MRLEKIQEYLKEKNWQYQYVEEDGLASVDLEYRGVAYHIWEYEDGAESNVRSGGRQEEFGADYEEEILKIIKEWK